MGWHGMSGRFLGAAFWVWDGLLGESWLGWGVLYYLSGCVINGMICSPVFCCCEVLTVT